MSIFYFKNWSTESTQMELIRVLIESKIKSFLGVQICAHFGPPLSSAKPLPNHPIAGVDLRRRWGPPCSDTSAPLSAGAPLASTRPRRRSGRSPSSAPPAESASPSPSSWSSTPSSQIWPFTISPAPPASPPMSATSIPDPRLVPSSAAFLGGFRRAN